MYISSVLWPLDGLMLKQSQKIFIKTEDIVMANQTSKKTANAEIENYADIHTKFEAYTGQLSRGKI